MAKKPVNKVTLLLPEEDFRRFDQYCRDRGYKKSTLLARLLRQYLDIEGYGTAAREGGFTRPGRMPGR